MMNEIAIKKILGPGSSAGKTLSAKTI